MQVLTYSFLRQDIPGCILRLSYFGHGRWRDCVWEMGLCFSPLGTSFNICLPFEHLAKITERNFISLPGHTL